MKRKLKIGRLDVLGWILIWFFALAFAAHALTVTLTWTDSTAPGDIGQEEEFVLERHLAMPVDGELMTVLDPSDTWGVIATVPADTTTYVDDTAKYRCYRAKARNFAGESEYSNVACMELEAPPIPGSLTISEVAFSVRLNWGGQELVLTGE